MYVCTYVCMYLCMYLCINVCMYVYMQEQYFKVIISEEVWQNYCILERCYFLSIGNQVSISEYKLESENINAIDEMIINRTYETTHNTYIGSMWCAFPYIISISRNNV